MDDLKEYFIHNYKRNLCIEIAYNGSEYHGWQYQNHKLTVQGVVQEKLSFFMNQGIWLFGASRTDAGVHALGQHANFYTNSGKSCEEIKFSINKMLPSDIYIKNIYEADPEFNARFNSKGKHYRYTLWTNREKPLFESHTTCYYPLKLDVNAMNQAAKMLEGTHDFTSFGSNAERPNENKIKTLWSVSVTPSPPYLWIDIKGNSFLYKMVRGISGTLLEIGRGKSIDIPTLFESKNRSNAGKNLPARGLCLLKVSYKEKFIPETEL